MFYRIYVVSVDNYPYENFLFRDHEFWVGL